MKTHTGEEEGRREEKAIRRCADSGFTGGTALALALGTIGSSWVCSNYWWITLLCLASILGPELLLLLLLSGLISTLVCWCWPAGLLARLAPASACFDGAGEGIDKSLPPCTVALSHSLSTRCTTDGPLSAPELFVVQWGRWRTENHSTTQIIPPSIFRPSRTARSSPSAAERHPTREIRGDLKHRPFRNAERWRGISGTLGRYQHIGCTRPNQTRLSFPSFRIVQSVQCSPHSVASCTSIRSLTPANP